jgi:hypothetical protein
MTGAGALHRFEQKLIPVRTTAGLNESWEAFVGSMLPQPLPDGQRSALIHQGFDAGYDAAMARVRAILADVQSEVLRENR